MKKVSKKVILIGNFGVGKTSLVRKFVFQKFSDEYLTTLGVKIDKKVVQTDQAEVNLLLWDVAGEIMQTKVPKSYYLGSHGVIYVFDLTRPSTFENIKTDLDYVQSMLPKATIFIAGNKSDLVTEDDIQAAFDKIPYDNIYKTSAKSGLNVEELFKDLTTEMVG